MIEYNKVFVDTNPFIYFIEKNECFYEKVKAFFRFARTNKILLVSSDITIAEYCVYPYRENNTALLEAFDRLLRLSQTEIVSTNEAIAKRAARLRAKYQSLRQMDALQLATAIETGCDMFYTNDRKLKQIDEINVITVDELQI